MSYKCLNCEKIYFDDFAEKSETCDKCGRKNSFEKIDCLYCDKDTIKNESTHFLCEECGVGMCDNCYDLMKEHDRHYHDICSYANCNGDSCDLEYEKQCDILHKHFGHYPDYICEKCLSKILEENDK